MWESERYFDFISWKCGQKKWKHNRINKLLCSRKSMQSSSSSKIQTRYMKNQPYEPCVASIINCDFRDNFMFLEKRIHFRPSRRIVWFRMFISNIDIFGWHFFPIKKGQAQNREDNSHHGYEKIVKLQTHIDCNHWSLSKDRKNIITKTKIV